MTDGILALNAGSSSLKFSLFATPGERDGLSLVCRGGIEGIGRAPLFRVSDATGKPFVDERLPSKALTVLNHEEALGVLLGHIESHEAELTLIAVGHRVVHGGTLFSAPALLDSAVISQLEQFVPLAPLHQPQNLAAIRTIARIRPGIPQVACFDTAFHYTQPPVAQAFALPHAMTNQGIKRYGFHGLSYEYIASVLPHVVGALADGRVVVAHLGSGASMCAMHSRQSRATTTGFTALDGLPMGTRCGAIDPGVILYLLSEQGMDVPAVTDLLYHHSGLLGVSGISSEMPDLLASDSPRAAEAIELFVYRIGRELGSLVAALGGLDVLVFTGGIGEHAAPIRARVCQDAQWLGIRLDVEANRRGGPRVSADDSAVSVWVIPTDEDLMIARHTREVLHAIRAAGNKHGGSTGIIQSPGKHSR
jgi:acetate kinase